MQPVEAAVETKKRRGDGVLSGLAKLEKDVNGLAQDIAILRQEARNAADQQQADNERELKLLRLAFANMAIEKTLEHHPSLTEDDREFLRKRRGFKV